MQDLLFELHHTIRFDRPIDNDTDAIFPGGYDMSFGTSDGSGQNTRVMFDFEYFECNIDKEKPCLVHTIHRFPDADCYPDVRNMTKGMLANVTAVHEFGIYVDSSQQRPAVPLEVTECCFLITDTGEKLHMAEGVRESIVALMAA